MILQTKASTLTALMATDGGKSPHLNALRDAIMVARAEARIASEVPPCPTDISNDRTTLEFQKKKDV